MYKKILIPLDGSPTAEKVLPYARAFSATLGTPIELLAIFDQQEIARSVSAAQGLYLDRLVEDETSRWGDYLAKIAETFAGVAAKASVKKGRTAEAIIESAAADKATLIMMATHGRSGLHRFLLGSVAEKVLRGVANPLLLVRADETARTDGAAALQSIIVPLDGSELAESILPMVEELAKQLALEIILLCIYAIPYGANTIGEGVYEPINLEAFLARLRQETVDYLESKTAELKRRSIDKISCVAREGMSADEIIKFARSTPHSLIAMCSHGYSGVKRWVLGSVTETVVRHAGNPVLVLRAEA